MFELQQASIQNRLLRAFAPDDFDLIKSQLSRVTLCINHSLSRPGRPIEFVHFPEDGLASVTSASNPNKIEVGLIGREGLTGIPLLLGAERCPNDTFIQMTGTFLRMSAADFLDVVGKSPAVQKLLLLYVHVYMTQITQTAMANASLAVEGRLARWLLLCHDRVDGDDLTLTHEFLAMMLGVRRPGVTVATHVLEGNGFIRAKRGRITILDRPKLEELADEAYGVAEAEYERLIVPYQ